MSKESGNGGVTVASTVADEQPPVAKFFENLKDWEVTDDFTGDAVQKKFVCRVIRKPNKQTFFRVHPEFLLTTAIIELEDARECYIVAPQILAEVRAEFPESVRAATVVLGVSRTGDYFVWPVKLPDPNGRANHWAESALGAVREARQRWTRLAPNLGAGLYDVYVAQAPLSEPKWPADKSWEQILEVAFAGRVIDHSDHAVLRQLRGLA